MQDIAIATALKICEHLNMSRVCVRLVPGLLSEDHWKRRISASRDFSRRWRASGDAYLYRSMRRGCISTILNLNSNRVYGL